MKRIRRSLGPLILAWLIGSCGDHPTEPSGPAVASIRISADTATLVPAGSIQLSATALSASGETVPRNFQWGTSNGGKATVSISGLVVGIAPGTARIIATVDGKSSSGAEITVLDGGIISPEGTTLSVLSGVVEVVVPPGALSTPASLWVRPTSGFATDPRVVTGAAFEFGPPGMNFLQPVVLKIKYAPGTLPQGTEEAALELYLHTSSGWQVVPQSTVDLTGKVVSAAVTHFSTYAILLPEPVAGIAIAGATSLTVGESAQLMVTLTAPDGRVLSNRAVTWSTSDATVATVSATGNVVALKAGSVTISATAGGKTSSVLMTVNAVPVASVTLSATTTPMVFGSTQTIVAAPKDANGNTLTGRTVTWVSSKPTVLSVSGSSSVSDANGAVINVTAVLAGSATITAAIETFSAITPTITVSPPPAAPVAAVAVTPPSASVVVGGTKQLTAVTKDVGGNVLTGRPITWTSNNTAVATVNGNGLVTALSAGGPVSITATSEGQSGSSSITVPALTVRANPFITNGLGIPVYLTQPLNDGRIFVVEKGGKIRVVRDGVLQTAPFLDISTKITPSGEQGLLSVTFHPQYATNHLFYVYFTGLSGEIRIERFTTTSDPSVADPASEKLIFTTPHATAANHNGGLTAFGSDGMLYAAFGDGGGAGDVAGNAQNFNVYLGGMIRIDVDHGDPYSVPANNPFVGQSNKKPELWAKGLRNPWRFAFDPLTGLLYIADVGQNLHEEVDVVSATQGGINYGWNTMEGFNCYNATTCNQTGLQLPVIAYDHTGGACSITGGFVYRGSAMPTLRGHYFYADYCAGWVRSLRYQNGLAVDQNDWGVLFPPNNALSFGQDIDGELYVMTANSVFKLVPGN